MRRRMNLKRILTPLVCIILIGIAGCSSLPQTTSPKISYDDFARDKNFSWSTNAEVDQTIVVTLPSNPSTGFTWPDVVQLNNKELLQQKDHKFVPSGQTQVVGASGQDVWTFKTINEGTAVISMDYSQPWQGGVQRQFSFTAYILIE
jgi:inhibitor of cysteine peptidase